MSFVKTNLTFNEYAKRLKEGATLKFDTDKGREFWSWYKFWNTDAVATFGYNPDEKDKMTIKL